MPVDVISVRAEYDGSAEGAKQAAKEAATAVDRMADQVTAASRKIDAASGRMDAFSQGMARLVAQSKATYGPMDKLGDEIKQTGDQADGADGKVKGLGDQVDKTGEKAKKAKASLSEIGSTLSTHVTLPIIAAGAAAVKFATDVETNFSHVEGLVGITGQALEDLKSKTEALAGPETGQGIRALSDGLYFITSSGLQGQKAIDALEASAKAATAGLGSVGQVADAVTSAVNAYTGSNLSASEATDILTNTVKEGKVEADALASTIGAAIPIASAAGVSFDQVGAAVALLSRNGASAGEAVTQVRSSIDAIIKPSEQAKDMLAGVGLTTDDLKKSLSEQGLLGTMRLLRDRFGEDTESLAKWAGRIEALNAILSITGGDAKEVDRVFQSLKNSTGLTDAAFDAASKTAGVKMRNALNDVETAGVNLGAAILPVIGDVAGSVGDAASKFGEMDKSSQNTVIAFGGVAAAAGPAIKAISGIKTALESVTLAGGVAGLAAGVAVAGLAKWYLDGKAAAERAEEAQNLYTDALRAIDDPGQIAVDRVHDLVVELQSSKDAAAGAAPEIDAFVQKMQGILGEDAAALLDRLGISMETVKRVTEDGTDWFGKYGTQLGFAGFGAEHLSGRLKDLNPEQRRFVEQLIAATDAEALSEDELKKLLKAIDHVADARDDQREADEKAAKAAALFAVRQGTVTQAFIDSALAAGGWEEVTKRLADVKMTDDIQGIAEKALEAGVGFDEMNGAAEKTPSAFEKARAEFEKTEQKAEDVTKAIEDMQTALTGAFDAEGAQREAAVKLAESHQKLHDKTKALDDATRTYGEGSTEAATADYERTRALDETEAAARAKAEADVTAAVKQAESMGVTISAKDQNYIYRDSLVATRDATGDPQLAQYLDDLIYRLDLERLRAQAAADALAHRNREIYTAAGMEANYAVRDSSGTAVVRRASGGPLFAKQLALVGEDGPELFLPDAPGTVVDALQTNTLLTAAATQTNMVAVNAEKNRVIENYLAYRNSIGLETTAAMLAAKAAPQPPTVESTAGLGHLGLPGGGFSSGPARGGTINVPVPVHVPEILPDVTGLVGPETPAGPMGRFGSFAFPSTLPKVTPATTVIVNVKVDGWANADPRQLGKAAYQALTEEARRRGNSQLRDVLAGIGRL